MNMGFTENVAKLNEIFPNRQPFHSMVEVLDPEIAKYAEMHLSSRIPKIPWEAIYRIIKKDKNRESKYNSVKKAIWEFNKEYAMKAIRMEAASMGNHESNELNDDVCGE